jgi:hypothetical protein
LAVGYGLGFTGLSLAYWAVGLGIGFTLASGWLVYWLVQGDEIQHRWLAIGLSLGVVASGPVLWATLSGMETAIMLCATLFCLYTYEHKRARMGLGALIWVALMRPEGAVIALSTAFAWAWRKRRRRRVAFIFLAGAGGAIFLQPGLNWLITGEVSATGTLAKSHLYNLTIPLDERLTIIFKQWLQIWREWVTGYNRVDGLYILPLLSVLALWMGWYGLRRTFQTRQIHSAVLVWVWLIGLSLAIATLDTAFWHFKRYQLPMMVLFFPLVGWQLHALLRLQWQQRPLGLYLVAGITTLNLGITGATALEYARRYENNIWVVRNQQIVLAEWIEANVPPDAVLAVHDVGVMRYVGQRTTYDVVGLTSPDTALAWRQGPGTLYENLRGHQPDYFAIYPDIQGLPLLVEAGVYGSEVYRVQIDLPVHTAAAATGTQVITQPDWAVITQGSDAVHQPISLTYRQGFKLLRRVNVADLESEKNANYTWWNRARLGGFASTVRHLPYYACETARDSACRVTDGGRVLTGGEAFDLPRLPDGNLSHYLVVMRVHAAQFSRLWVGCGDTRQLKIVPSIPGHWVEIPILLPKDTQRFCIETDGLYEPHYYWVYGGQFTPQIDAIGEITHFTPPDATEEGEILVKFAYIEVVEDTLTLEAVFSRQGEISSDGKVFIHLYASPNQPPVRQIDAWVGGVLPPPNWLEGDLSASWQLSLAGLSPGEYQLALGFYDPATTQRYQTPDGDRYFVGTVRVD